MEIIADIILFKNQNDNVVLFFFEKKMFASKSLFFPVYFVDNTIKILLSIKRGN